MATVPQYPIAEQVFVVSTLLHLRKLRHAMTQPRYRKFFAAEILVTIKREQRALACVRRRRAERGCH